MTSTDGAPTPAVASAGLLQPGGSLVQRAKQGDRQALEVMFGQFLPPGETVRDCEYLGVSGMWGFGTHSFAAITDRRAASLRVGVLGAVTYQDGAWEHINSGVVAQPSRLMLHVAAALWLAAALASVLVWSTSQTDRGATVALAVLCGVAGTILLLPVLVSFYYRTRKCGLVLSVREGVSVYAFADRKRLRFVNRLYRHGLLFRESRLRWMASGARAESAPGDDLPERHENQDESGGLVVSGRTAGRNARGGLLVAAGALLLVGAFAVPLMPIGADEPFTYGDDAALDRLADDCAAGDGDACDRLYLESPVGSEYEDYGATCGDRVARADGAGRCRAAGGE